MKTALRVFSFSILASLACIHSLAQDTTATKPDTVSVGIYITSVHDIDFKQKEYTLNLWLWLKYKNKLSISRKTWKCHRQKPFPNLLFQSTAPRTEFTCS